MSYTLKRPLEDKIEILRITESSTSRHSHDFLEIAYVCSGEAEHSIDDNTGVLKTGNYFVVDYGASHQYNAKKNKLNIINCLFLPEIIDKAFTDVRSFNELCERYFFRISGRRINGPASNTVYKDNGTVGELFIKMYDEYTQKKEGYREIIRCLLCEIIIETVRKVGSNDRVNAVTSEVLKEIEENFRKHISLGDICNQMHYSLSYVSSRFHSDTGFTFTEYLQNRRIEESCRLLVYTDKAVSEIAEEVGYESLKFFNKIFKQVTKITPREFRKQNKI